MPHLLSSPTLPAPRTWAAALARPAFRTRAAALVLGLVLLVGLAIPQFYAWAQQQPGRVLPDPLLALLPRANMAVPIFGIMYSCVLATLAWLLRRPLLLLRALWAYLLLSLLRIGTVWLLPLLPPPDLVPMPDPFTELVFHAPHGELITHDLFFSGHTAAMTLLVLAIRGRWKQRGLALAAVAVGLLVLVQRVHYSYDVLAAPLFTWLAYWAASYIARGAEL